MSIPALVLLLLAVAGGCSGSTEPFVSGNDLMPLAIGNRWIYVADTLIPGYEHDTIEIAEDMILGWNRERWFRSRETARNYGVLYTNRADGLWINPTIDFTYLQHYGLHPARKGDVFNHDTLPGVSLDGTTVDTFATAAVVRAIRRVTVPAGIFNCYVYTQRSISQSTGDTLYGDEYFIAPGVGIVKYAIPGPNLTVDSNGVLWGRLVHYSLRSYTLK